MDRVQPVVAVVLLDVVVPGVAGAAEHLDGQVVGGQAPLRGPALGDRGEDPQHLLRLGLRGRVVQGRDVVDQPRAVEVERQGPLDVGLLGEQHPAHVRVLDQRHLRGLRRRTHGPALQPLARIGQGLQVAGVAQGGGAQADADPGLVHHREHGGQAPVLGADEVADGARAPARREGTLTEDGGGVDRAAEAHLVVDPGQHHVVALADRTVLGHQELRHQEQGDPLGADRGAGGAGEHEVHDVLAHLVVPAGDPHLAPEEPVGAVGLRLGPGGDVGQVGACLRLREGHRAEEPAGGHGLHEPADQLRGRVDREEVGIGQGEQRVARRTDVGRVEPRHARPEDRRGQLQPAGLLAQGRCQEPRVGEGPQRRLDLRDQLDPLPVEPRLREVRSTVVRSEVVGRDPLGESQQVLHDVAGVLGEPWPLEEPLGVEPLEEQEVQVAARHDQAHRHSSSSSARSMPTRRTSPSRRRRPG